MYRSRSLRKPSDRPDEPDPRTLSPSRLPVKPPLRTASAAAAKPGARGGLARAASTRDGTRYPPPSSRTVSAAGRDGLVRPGTGRSAEGAKARAQAGGASGETARTRTLGASAASEGARPRAATGTGTGTRTGAGHARTRSTTVLSSAPSLRPPSQPTRGQPPPARQPSHARTKSSTATLPGASLRGPQPKPQLQPKPQSKPQPAPPNARTRAPHLKPAFNNNQQHYSPARNTAPKPLTATFLAPPSPGKLPANVALSAETLRLQNDLLRHHVLHAASGATTASWHASAAGRLGGRFERLAAESRALSAEEARLLEDVNVRALRGWGAGGLEGKVQGLDALLAAVWRASEPGGKHARVARRFERWAERAREAEEARGSGGILDGDEPALVGGLDGAWRDECGALRAKLEAWRGQLEGLGHVPRGEGSNLEGMLRGCGELIAGMLGELALMVEIEEAIVGREKEWVRGVIGSVGDEASGAGAIWRAA